MAIRRLNIPKHSEKPDKNYELHSVCVIGYNDDEQVFEIQNSWGVQWGHQGYAFVGYTTLMEYIQQAFVLI
jgi:C1A family cysteine protease